MLLFATQGRHTWLIYAWYAWHLCPKNDETIYLALDTIHSFRSSTMSYGQQQEKKENCTQHNFPGPNYEARKNCFFFHIQKHFLSSQNKLDFHLPSNIRCTHIRMQRWIFSFHGKTRAAVFNYNISGCFSKLFFKKLLRTSKIQDY